MALIRAAMLASFDDEAEELDMEGAVRSLVADLLVALSSVGDREGESVRLKSVLTK